MKAITVIVVFVLVALVALVLLKQGALNGTKSAGPVRPAQPDVTRSLP